MAASFRHVIDGEHAESDSGARRQVMSPATGDVIATVPDGTSKDAQRAVEAALVRADEFRSRTVEERVSLLRAAGDAVEDERDRLAEWVTDDQGKPIREARAEVDGAAATFRHTADALVGMTTEVYPGDRTTHQFTLREPHGVLGVITPWNFPVNLPAEHISAGVAAGNAVVWVPAPTTSACGLVFAKIVADVFPDGLLNVVTGEGTVVGDAVVRDEDVHAIGFTGSPETGREIHRNAGVKPTVLELGGNGPVVIMDDADLETAIEATAFSCFNNAGQVCSSSERVLVHKDVVAEVTEGLIEWAERYMPSDPHDEDAMMGPLNNGDVKAKLRAHIDDAVAEGATVAHGDDREGSLFHEPVVLRDVTDGMLVTEEETFGPIAPLIAVESVSEAINRANADSYGLSSSIFTTDLERAHEFVEGVHAGLAKVNIGPQEGGSPGLPYGGYTGTQSGIGRLGGTYGIESYSQIKTVVMNHRSGK